MNSFSKTLFRGVLLPGLLALAVLACTGPEHETVDPDGSTPEAGVVSGKATDVQGKPLTNANIVVNNTQFYNHNLLGQTDASGRYRLDLTPGSWYVRGTTSVKFDNKTYVLDLHPNSDAAFAGTEGAVRNLTLKLSGGRTGEFGNDGYYGGQIEVFPAFGGDEFIETEKVQLTLEPVGGLVDGSAGKTLTVQPDGMYIDDVPLGKYKITARYESNRPMRVRIRNKNQTYQNAITASFDPAYEGATGRYKLNVEVQLAE